MFSSLLETRSSMKTMKHLPFWMSVFFVFTFTSHSEVLDRIIAVVEGHVITLSDVRQEREIRGQQIAILHAAGEGARAAGPR